MLQKKHLFLLDLSVEYKHSSSGFFIFSIDATEETPSLGRLVNHSRHPNSKMRVLSVDDRPCLCLFALADIQVNDEILYDYGLSDYPFIDAETLVSVVFSLFSS